jgi:hypothetical protein
MVPWGSFQTSISRTQVPMGNLFHQIMNPMVRSRVQAIY